MAHYHLLLRQTAEAIATMVAAFGPLSESANPRWVARYFDIWFLIAARLGRYGVTANGWRANSAPSGSTNSWKRAKR